MGRGEGVGGEGNRYIIYVKETKNIDKYNSLPYVVLYVLYWFVASVRENMFPHRFSLK